jgi:hypothetical protein
MNARAIVKSAKRSVRRREANLAALRSACRPVRLPHLDFLALIFCSWSLGGVQVGGNAITMGKKKSLQTSKAATKAAKKSKATQKTERKEKRKLGKAKDELDDDQDLEAILENVSEALTAFTSPLLANEEYASRSAANGKRRTRLPRNSSMVHLAGEPTRR